MQSCRRNGKEAMNRTKRTRRNLLVVDIVILILPQVMHWQQWKSKKNGSFSSSSTMIFTRAVWQESMLLYLRPLFISCPNGCIGWFLGHTLTPFCFVIRQHLGFFPGQVHILEVSFDDIYPVLPWSSRFSLVTSQFPVHCLASRFGVVHSQDVSQPSEHSFFNYIFQFPWTSFLS